jgi:hypothetical protein
MSLLDRLLRQYTPATRQIIPQERRPLIYSWIQSGKFAIGPMPQTAEQWLQLEQAGSRRRDLCDCS